MRPAWSSRREASAGLADTGLKFFICERLASERWLAEVVCVCVCVSSRERSLLGKGRYLAGLLLASGWPGGRDRRFLVCLGSSSLSAEVVVSGS